MRYASSLRFPKLLAITAALFVLDLIFPDMIPFVDEILLGLISLLFASLRRNANAAPDSKNTGKS